MKCIKQQKTIVRVSDAKAAELTKKGWVYCPKKRMEGESIK